MSQSVTAGPQTLPNGRLVPTEPMTYEQFLEWLTDDTHAEWVNGWVVPMSPVNSLHDQLVRFFGSLLQLYLEFYPVGQLRGDPFQMRPAPDLPGRAPDVIFIANEHLSRLHNSWLAGPADIAVEVVSPDSVQRDRVNKFGEYERGGVREYWLIDATIRQAEFFQLSEEGCYRTITIGEDRIFRSTVLPAWWLKTEWLWQEPLPKLTGILREWGLI